MEQGGRKGRGSGWGEEQGGAAGEGSSPEGDLGKWEGRPHSPTFPRHVGEWGGVGGRREEREVDGEFRERRARTFVRKKEIETARHAATW